MSLLVFSRIARRMAVAHEALQYVFKLHAGYLQSYAVDEHKRMLKSSHILLEAERAHGEYLGNVCEVLDTLESEEEYVWSGEMAKAEAEILLMDQQVIERLLRIAPNYIEKRLQRVPQDKAESKAIIDAYHGEVGRRLGTTKEVRVKEVLKLTAAYYAADERSLQETTELADRIKYILHDLLAIYGPEAIEQEDDDFIEDITRLLERILNRQTNQPATPDKENKNPKRKGKKCKKSKKRFLEKMD